MQTDLTIVILTYNSAHIIGACLSNLNFEKYKIVVVDNASTDNTVEVVAQKFPQVQLIKLPQNIGYGRGNNAVLEKVDTQFALVLNPDAVIFEKDIETVLSEMRKNPQIAMAGPLVLDKFPFDEEEFKSKMKKIDEDFFGIKDNYREKIGDNYAVRFLIGAALFMRVEIFSKIGFFDKNIFLYYEDDELCYRVEKNGYKNVVIPSAIAFHIGGQSSQTKGSLRSAFKKNWHLKGWSKLYWKEVIKGKLRAKRSAAKMTIKYLIAAIFSALKFNFVESAGHLGTSAGAFSYLIGCGAFKKDGASRG